MLNQLLNNPAYMRLLKNATSLNASEIVTVPGDVIPIIPPTVPMIISAAKPVTSPPIKTTTVINTGTTKNTDSGKYIFYIVGGIILGIVLYNIYEYKNQNKKSKKQ